MQLSSIPFLIAALLGFTGWLTLRARRLESITIGQQWAVWALLAALLAWAGLSAYLALSGTYLTSAFLQWLPGLWLPLVPFAIVGLTLAASRGLRHALIEVLDVTPPLWLVLLQALRISAAGTLIKTLQGEFPYHFELGVGIPDLLFGLSALVVALAVSRNAIGWFGLAVWNLIGFAVVSLPALLLAQMGLPGPMQIFHGPPASEALLVYPMALAPTVVVPLFLMLNLWVAAWLFVRRPKIGFAHEAGADLGNP
jgi:hypothetical protein